MPGALAINVLHIGDNLDILRRVIPDESIDLVYLDPPFNSNKAYSTIFRDSKGRKSDAQQFAFDDTWDWRSQAETSFREVVTGEAGTAHLASLISSLVGTLERVPMTAYLVEMAVRLVEMHRVLKPTGSLYLHCDPVASHYLKVVLDAVFGPTRFRNEIIWRRSPFSGSSKARSRQLPKSHDVILFYSKGPTWTWHGPTRPYLPEYLARFRHDDGDGRGPYRKSLLKTFSKATFDRMLADNRLVPPVRDGANWSLKQYLAESSGTRQFDDIWDDINSLNPVAKERLGYPTQKPLALLERIIEASSNEGDVVLDPFCGCGTALEAAENKGRRWVGIDITPLAHEVIERRFQRVWAKSVDVGEEAPTDVAGAQALARRGPQGRTHFERWALTMIGARHTGASGGRRDRGVDGRLMILGSGGRPVGVLVSVKSGHVKPGDIRDLKGAVGRERAAIGLFITLEPPTTEMRLEATSAGNYQGVDGRSYPKIQLLTIAEMLHPTNPVRPRLPEVQPTLFGSVDEAASRREFLAEAEAELVGQIAEAKKRRDRVSIARLERILKGLREQPDYEGVEVPVPAVRETAATYR